MVQRKGLQQRRAQWLVQRAVASRKILLKVLIPVQLRPILQS
jgi:hypothetical protein